VKEDDFMRNENLEEQSLRASASFFFRHSIRDIGRRKFHYSLAFCSVFIVVLATLVINTAVERGPIVFLRMAEGKRGEIDAIITPHGEHKQGDDANNGLLLNYTKMTEVLDQAEFHLSPRKVIKAV
jgi:hypothetical protein